MSHLHPLYDCLSCNHCGKITLGTLKWSRFFSFSEAQSWIINPSLKWCLIRHFLPRWQALCWNPFATVAYHVEVVTFGVKPHTLFAVCNSLGLFLGLVLLVPSIVSPWSSQPWELTLILQRQVSLHERTRASFQNAPFFSLHCGLFLQLLCSFWFSHHFPPNSQRSTRTACQCHQHLLYQDNSLQFLEDHTVIK